MTLELFHASESLCSQKVKLVLAEKNLEWRSHLLNLLTFDNLHPSYVLLNPQAVVPTLIDDGQVITDSDTIIKYLDEKFPDPKLTFTKLEPQTQMNRWLDLQKRLPMRELMYGNFKGIEGIVLRRSVQLKERTLTQLIQTHPELEEQYSVKLQDVRQWNSTIRSKRKVAQINAKLDPMLDCLENQLSNTNWLCGSTYSLADTVWTTILYRLERSNFSHLWRNNTRPNLDLYLNRLKLRPSFVIAVQDDRMSLSMLFKGLCRTFIGI